MSTKSPIVQPADHNDLTLHESDAAAVLEHFASGKPLDPTVVERIRARAEQVTAEVQRDHGLVNDETFQSLLDDEA